mmetsp:Transcript_13652/g.29328  ORF Transcript_13652/g.29328 Transcript_13652/m.29328 type:complete len:160 (-) Transcript_13652:188-667(-)
MRRLFFCIIRTDGVIFWMVGAAFEFRQIMIPISAKGIPNAKANAIACDSRYEGLRRTAQEKHELSSAKASSAGAEHELYRAKFDTMVDCRCCAGWGVSMSRAFKDLPWSACGCHAPRKLITAKDWQKNKNQQNVTKNSCQKLILLGTTFAKHAPFLDSG